MISTAIYLASVVAVNIAFSHYPELNWLWSILVGGIFVARDFCQRSIGHWALLPMAGGILLSWWMADPFVAMASAAAFAVSESVDWGVFTVTKRPLRDRVLWSCAASAPIDSAVFLLMAGFFSWPALGLQIGSKLLAAIIVWLWLTQRYMHRTQPA